MRAPHPNCHPDMGCQRSIVRLPIRSSSPYRTLKPLELYETTTGTKPPSGDLRVAGTVARTVLLYDTTSRESPPVCIVTRRPDHTSASPNAVSGSGPYRKLVPSAPQCLLMPACPQLPPDMLSENDAMNLLIGRSPSVAETTTEPISPYPASVSRTAPREPSTVATPRMVAFPPTPSTVLRFECSAPKVNDNRRDAPERDDGGVTQDTEPFEYVARTTESPYHFSRVVL